MRILSVALMLTCVGCGSAVVPTADRIDLTGELTQDGKPVTGVKLNLQPTGNGLPAVIDVVDGAFNAEVVPGTYTYYVSPGKKAEDFKAIPESFQSGSMERQFDVADGTTLELTIE